VFAKRQIRPELLDHAPPESARRCLADLVRINTRFGGHAAIQRALAQVATEKDKFTLIDIGAASGDVARVLQGLYPLASITSLDCNSVNLENAPPPQVIADAFSLPFLSESFDFVHCSLFLHHFEDDRIIDLLRCFYRTARRALIVCDLERHLVPYGFLPLTKYLFGWEHMTVHDGQISVRAGFRASELLRLSEKSGIEDARILVHRPAFRISLVARKRGA